MKERRLHLIRTVGAALFVILASTSKVTAAVERWVVPDTSQCAADTTVNPCHTTLSDAVTNASAGDSIKILPGTYPANVTLTKNITIIGVETARTFLQGGGGTAIIVSGVTTAMVISNLTFTSSAPAISVTNGSTQVTIKNNVFLSTNTGIQPDSTSTPVILNNTFYDNGTAILSNQNNLSIVNNIFFSNDLAISANVALDNIQYNLFNPTSTAGPSGIVFDSTNLTDPNNKRNISGDPSFINPSASDIAERDFHLKSDTACKQKGTESYGAGVNSINGVSPPDIGAYGGAGSDTIPFPVSGLGGTDASSPPTTYVIDLTWSLNSCYFVAGYNIYYDTDQSGAPYANTKDAGNVSSFPYPLQNLTLPSVPTLTKPLNLQSSPESGTLNISWSRVDGAIGYTLYYREQGVGAAYTPKNVDNNVGNTILATISGLKDPAPDGTPTWYDFYVEPYYQATIYVAVKAYYAQNTPSKEALAYSKEASVKVGGITIGPSSDVKSDFPEPITPYPPLPNKGCFIATAAFGYYSAPQVQALRKLRDRYLMTNAPGRAFVGWYYTYGPVAAQFINEHPGLKPAVRVALLPAVGGAMFMTRTSASAMAILFIVLGLLALYASLRAMKTRRN